ncbi:MAG: hypothetical protein KME17_10640 [Cyanosarcina radialis HA8281-LM2]|jgi:hypothetical protein|nr:hypothetical protein [Cyanosarcina radialis HA8281-LM2]
MHRLSLGDIVLYEIAGPALCVDNVAIVPAFYELLADRTEYDFTLNFSLSGC